MGFEKMFQKRFCPQCGTQLRWIGEYNQYWCDQCGQYRLMKTQIEEPIDELIDGFKSDYIKRGRYSPYGIYVTTNRIFGIKDGGLKRRILTSIFLMIFALGVVSMGSLLGIGGIFIFLMLIGGSYGFRFILRRFFAKKVYDSKKPIIELKAKKDFELYKNDVHEVRLQKSKSLFGGPWSDLIIRSAKGEFIINVHKDSSVARLKNMFTKFIGGKFTTDKGNE
jgi:DNA-directed RNA polymerase subunit RPC12/RpoP